MSIELNSDFLDRKQKKKETKIRICEWADCEEPGLCKAPKSRDEIDSFRWFCKSHARQYNLAWNYYAGMTEEEIERDVRGDTTWHRPSWKLGTIDPVTLIINCDKIFDPLKIYKKKKHANEDFLCNEEKRYFTSEQKRALSIFQLSMPISIKNIKKKYKQLVKLHHPDAIGTTNNISKTKSEERIKDINKAYRILLKYIEK